MPVYRYECESGCGEFEDLVPIGSPNPPCSCGKAARRIMSVPQGDIKAWRADELALAERINNEPSPYSDKGLTPNQMRAEGLASRPGS
jgi:putative FmdB family regulatory protein